MQSDNLLITIHDNASLKEISLILEKNKIINNSVIFRIVARLTGNEKVLKAGEYEFYSDDNMYKVLKKLKNGEFKKYAITIPEGYTTKEIADLIFLSGIGSREDFLKLVYDKELIQKYNINAESLEGYLFPDTYYFFKGISERKIINLMLSRFFEVFKEKYQKRASEMKYTTHEIVILASIIVKEAKVEEERRIISAVFQNRLKKRMRLESCATILYALGKHKDRLWEEDLKIDSLYNTYKYYGLPIGPISNPGHASIYAALYPENVDYLYFVSKNDGTHEFSKTFKEHVRTKKKYIR